MTLEDFPIFNSKILSDGNKYFLTDPVDRKKYFEAKLGKEIEDIKSFMENNTFVGFMLSKKGAGKGTFSKMFEEIFGSDRFHHISVGDIVRDVNKALGNPAERAEIEKYLQKYYRGFISLDDALSAFVNYSQDKLIPSEFILTLVKREVEKVGRKSLFIDGIPRDMDQISYSLFFRDLINFRDDPDFFIIIDTPESVIEERFKYRRVCDLCKTSKNIKLNPSKFVAYDKDTEEFYLVCDNSICEGYEKQRLVQKAGDDKGLESIRERLDRDDDLMSKAHELSGIQKILLRTSLPVDIAEEVLEDYEFNPEFYYEQEDDKIKTCTRPWKIVNDDGSEGYVIIGTTIVANMVSQIHDILI